jgi:predicted ATPase
MCLDARSEIGCGVRSRRVVESANGLIGRDQELEIIEHEFNALKHGSQRAVVVLGEAGIGKTALLAAAVQRAHRRGHTGVMGRAAEYERDLPFSLFIEALDDALSANSGVNLNTVVDIEYLAPIFSSVEAIVRERRSTTPDERQHVIRAMRSLLGRMAADRPMVLALDDLHWADPASADLVCQLLHRPLDAPVLVALSARPHQLDARLAAALEEAERSGAVRPAEPSPLSADEADALLGNELRPDVRRRLYRQSGGCPSWRRRGRGFAE